MSTAAHSGTAAVDGGGAAATSTAAVAALIELAVDVLGSIRASRAADVEVPALLTADGAGKTVRLDPELVEQVEPELAALRRFLLGENGARPAAASNGLSSAAYALRNLLEIVLDERLELQGDSAKRKRTEKDGLEAARRYAVDAAEARQGAAHWTVRNLTAGELSFDEDGAEWILPAFGARTIDHDPRGGLDVRQAQASGRVEILEPPPPKTPARYEILASYIYVLPLSLVAILYWGGTWGWVLGVVGLVLPLVGLALASARKHSERLWGVARELPAQLLQAITFLIVLTFCLAVPAVTLYYGADLDAAVSNALDGNASPADQLTLVCRAMQLVLIAVVSLLPALLYYQFDRDRMSTLREKFVQQIFRLDSRLTTKGAIYAKYGPLIDENYGPERTGRYRRLPPGRRAPIFVATVLIMLGWLLVMLNPDVGLIQAENGVTAEDKIAELFEPRQTAPAFAFLGAYFFTLFALLRGYVRRDLRPKSYSDISVRIVAVVILAWVLELAFDDGSNGLLAAAFVVGIVPQAALNWLRESWQVWLPRLGGSGGPRQRDDDVAAALSDPLPLTDLEGIDLYDRTRLASEGVTNIEALAHHDLIELMLTTRIPAPRLIDWTDQAILYLHTTGPDRRDLRRYGIRTASDLEYAYRKAEEGRACLAILDGNKAGAPGRLAVVLQAIEDEEWMGCIRSWHGHAARPGDKGAP